MIASEASCTSAEAKRCTSKGMPRSLAASWLCASPARRLEPAAMRRDTRRTQRGGTDMADVRIVAEGFGFPEGPVVMPDGAVVLTEIAGSCVTRIGPDGARAKLGNPGGGPNGLAIGPDGALYLCNNGGGKYPPGHWMATGPADDYDGGCIQRIDPK